MAGNLGNDVYYVDNSGDSVTENAGAGTDRVVSSVSYTLADEDVEYLTLSGAAAINGAGNASANAILGNGAANVLSGLGGNDAINGNGGNDTIAAAPATTL